ncbi:MAG: hypothetical protein OXG40_16255 [Acidimicrobiaceae bacterium]|nr:hypothetical protein [Acidimicrobiaceae bacterium]MDE0515494.1 hypothetical protein [Acidimicrobiaceae bacterium]MDE0657946.1 hypothetical protein [Acidimicrobiaceae bacterium]
MTRAGERARGRMWLPFKDWEGPVGTFDWPIRLDSMDGERSLHLDALVDTGSSCTSAPAGLLRELGVVPKVKVRMELADGRTAIYDMGEARATVSGRSAITWVTFGDDDARPLLGAHTLQGLLLTVDPWKHEVVPTPYLLR